MINFGSYSLSTMYATKAGYSKMRHMSRIAREKRLLLDL